MCSLSQLGINLTHNAGPHYGTINKTKTPFPQAWGICILESQRKLTPNQAALLNLGTTTSPAIFTKTMLAISSGELQVHNNRVRVIFNKRTKAEELSVLKRAKELFRQDPWRRGGSHPVAFFAWKLLDITEIEEPKNRLPEINRASDHSVPPQYGTGESKTSWGLRNRSKHFLRTTSTSSKLFYKGGDNNQLNK